MQYIIKIVVSFLPFIWLFASMGFLKVKSYVAGLTALAGVMIVSPLVFDFSIINVLGSTAEGSVYAFINIVWVIWNAIFLFNISKINGYDKKFNDLLCNISEDKSIQVLIVAFAFGGLLEGLAGFGTAVVIPASILISIGIKPLKSIVICLVANTVPVAFGVLGVPVITLSDLTGLSLNKLSVFTAIQLFVLAIALPLILLRIYSESFKKLRGYIFFTLLLGIVFAGTQLLVTLFMGPHFAAVISSIVALIFIKLWVSLVQKRKSSGDKQAAGFYIKTLCPYLCAILLLMAIKFLPIVSELGSSQFALKFQLYFGLGGKALKFNLFTNAGTILFVSAIITAIVQKIAWRSVLSSFGKTLYQIRFSLLTILSIVSVAKIMTYCGMLNIVSSSLVAVSGGFYPFLAPILGLIGSFLTGSDTSSNILFGQVQNQAATSLNLNNLWITSANASGATLGKMISPQSISLAMSIKGDETITESKIIKKVLIYCGLMALVIALIVLAGSKII